MKQFATLKIGFISYLSQVPNGFEAYNH